MTPYTDTELRDLLLYHGYNVPLIVIRTWGNLRSHGSRKAANRRSVTERWMHYMMRDKGAHHTAMPEFLMAFSIRIKRRLPRIDVAEPPRDLPRVVLPISEDLGHEPF